MRVLNVAEKPSVAKEIAQILSAGRCQRRPGFSQYNAIFEFPYEIQHQRVEMVITSVTGHLMELEFPAQFRDWHSCDPMELFTAPVKKSIRKDETQQKIEKTLMTEARRCEWLVLWLDCDREGENIAFEVKAICEQASRRRLRISRARFSALIPQDIVHAVQHLDRPDEHLSRACDARSEIDLRIGAAFTRFQTVRIQRKFPMLKNVISYGPCQFPTLGFVVERFLKIQNFEKEAFHFISVTHEQQDLPEQPMTKFSWRRSRLYDRTACLCIFEQLVESPLATIVAVDRRPSWKRKPLPLTTVELQKRASRWLRISSEQAMKAAESLYNKGFISYPRTETNRFKEGTDLMGLLRMHENHRVWGTYISTQLLQGGKFDPPRHGGADDQAHPPIHPTKSIDVNSLSDPVERNLYEFVTRHFVACCSRDAVGDQTNVQMKIVEEGFTATGLMVRERNYLEIYKYEKWSASSIPVYQPGDTFIPTSLLMESGETAPPPLLSEADLISKMDANGIGTDATIAEHIKTILKREYAVKVNNNTQFKPTSLGLALVLSYEQMGLELAKPALRATMERDCKAIALGEKDMKQVVDACMNQMKSIFQSVRQHADILDLTFSEHFGHELVLNHEPREQRARPHVEAVDASFRGPQSNAPTGPVDHTSVIPRCTSHGLECIERRVREGRNAGRFFFACPLPQNERCDFFQWSTYSDGPSDNVGPVGDSARRRVTGVRCSEHNEPCVELTVKKEGPTKGRQFYACALPAGERCDFFEWKDSGNTQVGVNVPLCPGHNRPCALRKRRQPGEHRDREFFACSLPMNESCGFFVWKDEATSVSTGRRGQGAQPKSTDANPECECGSKSILLVCRNGANKGRSFFKCSGNGQENQCSFFQWV